MPINNGGIQKPEKLLEQPGDLGVMDAEIGINLLGQIRLTAALLPCYAGKPAPR